MSADSVYDVVIIGGGPAGATAALYASRAQLRTLVVDKAIRAGALGLTSKIANYPGIKEVLTGEELVQRMWEHAQAYGAQFKKAKVTGTVLTQGPKQLFTAEGETILAKAVILATGAMGRSQTVPGEQEFLGRGVSYCATCDGAFFKDQEVLVYGATEEAADEALFLTRYASKVYLAFPKPELAAGGELKERVATQAKIVLLARTRLKAIGGNSAVTHAVLLRGSGEERLPINGVFVFTQGGKPILDYVGGQVELMLSGCVRVDSEMATSIPGVFACGDLLCTDVQQAVVAAAQGCIAALAADKHINKRPALVKDYR